MSILNIQACKKAAITSHVSPAPLRFRVETPKALILIGSGPAVPGESPQLSWTSLVWANGLGEGFRTQGFGFSFLWEEALNEGSSLRAIHVLWRRRS